MSEAGRPPSRPLSYADAALRLLEEAGAPLHYRDLTQRALDEGLLSTEGRTPERTMNAILSTEIQSKGAESRFVRTGRGTFGLRVRDQPEEIRDAEDGAPEAGETERRVRIPFYPRHREVRALLRIWDGTPVAAVAHLQSTVWGKTGTPQAQRDWTDPDTWIPERLEGEDIELARRMWRESEGAVNPRHVVGHRRLIENYGLLRNDAGTYRLTDRGRDFLDHPLGVTEQGIDEQEGLLRILTMVSEVAPVPRGDLDGPWHEYLLRFSTYQSEKSASHLLGARLRDLVDRGLLQRTGRCYEPTDQGTVYLEEAGGESADSSASQTPELGRLIREQKQAVKHSIRESLESLDPYDFERLIERLLEAMGYSDTATTSPSNDKGVDVLGDIQVGITSVREVIQVKRHKAKIQRKDLDALRGSLHRFDAVRGTIITSGDFSRGTLDAAFEKGAAPITLINGERLVELLIEHGIGVRKKRVELWEFDAADLTGADDEAEVVVEGP